MLKVAVIIPAILQEGQHLQLIRATVLLTVYAVLFKLVLINKKYINVYTHILIWIGIFVIGTNIFIMAQHVNAITLQFVFMISISGFYLLNLRFGLLYSSIAATMVITYLFLFEGASLQMKFSSQPITFTSGAIITVLNFITLIGSHYLFHQAIKNNIAEKELLNIQLIEAVALANKNAQSKSDFLSTMSHELRTPLNSVIGMTEILMHEIKAPEQKKSLEYLRFSAQSLHTLINDILDFNRFDSNKIQLEKVSVNLYTLAKNVCSGLEFQAKEKGLEIILKVDETIKVQNVITDPLRISQIIYNLIGNGIKFTNKGHVAVSLVITEIQEKTMRVNFVVTDTGIGINVNKHEDIFEPFVQATSHTARRFGGTGLGLAIVKRLLSLYDSDIKVKSLSGKGSTFYFDINFELDTATDIMNAEGMSQQNELKGLNVLIAEDNRINVFLMEKLAQRWNIELSVAENGKEVLKLLETYTYDLILMDIYMPEMDGYETTKRIRNLPNIAKAQIPIIALSATALSELGENIESIGVNDYVQKPFNAAELYSKLKKFISVSSV
jgi:signal transduction histidine kinase/CheY-like chemotaxis protein